ncbi:MAG TPA: type II toxin-antitoxin system HicA family toxin [Thermoanaerobaculia bacterium]|nr:type II toxin-antitoxin system HicA family toxin [Thermoanaerobaculia bacterium]
MKRREFEQHLAQHGCVFAREGARHTAFLNPRNGRIAAVPRHTELKKGLVRAVCKVLEIPDPFSE